ncbi:MAG: hypothetical protein WC249_01220 [Patescibacteria group bacterium]|jgi:hypothetical protein
MSFKINLNPEEISNRREKIKNEIDSFRQKISEKFTGNDRQKINEALEFMLKIHLPQKDRMDGQPFASHPLAVAEEALKLSDNPELIIAALIHDSVEDQPDYIFVERVNRKYPNRNFVPLEIGDTLRERHRDVFKAWSFREIEERFGDKIKYYTENMTNHDFNSLAEDLGLNGEDRQDFINKLYAEHVQDIINDPELFTLKLADLSINIDLHSLSPDSEKYLKLKRKYKSVIEAILERLINLEEGHPIYNKKNEIMAKLKKIYIEQYK